MKRDWFELKMIAEFLMCGLYGYVVYYALKDLCGEKAAGLFGIITYGFAMTAPSAWKSYRQSITRINENLLEIRELLKEMNHQRL